jgi:hypothetical protein
LDIKSEESGQLCSTYLCEREVHPVGAGKFLNTFYGCNNRSDCINTDMDETSFCEFEEYFQCTHSRKSRIDKRKVCDLQCDCWNYEDEGFCNNVTYGIYCERGTRGKYLAAAYVCNGFKHCKAGEDEKHCETEIVRNCKLFETHRWFQNFKDGIRPISQRQACTAPLSDLVCSDGLDQVNCTDPTRIALTCTIDSIQSTISIFAICKDHFLCDDGYDSNCVQPEGGCIIHKNQLCDRVNDCMGQQDENDAICEHLTNITCVRRVSMKKQSALPIPFDWVFDGVTDCIGGQDEDESYWKKCGHEKTVRIVEKATECKELLRCSDKKDGFIGFTEVCDRIHSCGRELEMCEKSRGIKKTFDTIEVFERSWIGYGSNIKALMFCLKGLNELISLAGNCTLQHNFQIPGESAEYAIKSYLNLPSSTVVCHGMFGENYVYMSCTNSCSETKCPLKPIPQDTCTNEVQRKVYALTPSNELQVLQRQQNGYSNELFPCRNKNCVP